MKKYVLLFAYLLLYIPSFATQGVIKDFNTNSFPKVSFYFHSDNPDSITKEQVRILEEGNSMDFIIETVKSDSIVSKCNVLFLWDLRVKGSHVPKILRDDYLPGLISESQTADTYKVNVAVFGKNGAGEAFYDNLMDTFTGGLEQVCDSIKSEVDRQRENSFSSSDIGWALEKAIRELSTLPVDEAKAIILFTDGKDYRDSNINSQTIVDLARKSRVIIYVAIIDGDIMGKELCTSIASRTYGQCQSFESNLTTIESPQKYQFQESEVLAQWIEDFPKRWMGTTYKVTFTSHSEKNGETKQILVDFDNDSLTTSYRIPDYSSGDWIREHLVLFLIFLFLLLVLAGVGGYFLIRYLRNRSADKKEEEERINAERKRLQSEQDTIRRKLEISEKEQRKMREKEAAKEREAKHQEQLSSLLSIMRTKNIKARLLVSTMTGFYEHVVNTPETTIGTADDNTVVIEDTTVSRHHAVLYFDGERFGIRDLKSTNGIIMNGFKVDNIKLRNGDSVSIGKTILKIYF